MSSRIRNAAAALVAATSCLVSATLTAADGPQLVLEEAGNPPAKAFVARDLPTSLTQGTVPATTEQWQELFAVFTVEGDQIAPAPLLGDYAVSNGSWSFAPRYPLRAGLKYRAILRVPGAKGQPISRDFHVPMTVQLSARLTAIYPSTDVVPENLLKFYLHFSAPMSRGEIYRRVKLIDSADGPVEFPFLELTEELWSPDGMRVTLFFDPGRIKRGLKPRELFGPALQEGHAYTLQIDPAWVDAHGNPLADRVPVSKSFRVVAPDDRQPDTERWKLIVPAAGSRDPVVIVFDEPMDSAMLLRVVSIVDRSEEELAGDFSLAKSETMLTFRPATPWAPGRHAVSVDTTLEDLSGNSLGQPFEVDVFRPAPDRPQAKYVKVPFTIPE